MRGRRLAREPLLHFLLLGAALFALHRWASEPAGEAASEIVVSRGRIASLEQPFAQTWQRSPTEAELDGLIEDHIRDEVLYREAVALGLDRDDTVVRRRLRQKLEFLFEDRSLEGEATEPELARHLQENAADYRVESRLSFSQVFLDPGKRGADLEADAARILVALRRAPADADPVTGGDSLMLSPRYENASTSELVRLFGADFELALRDAPLGAWFGPVTSGYGAHLVRVEAREAARTPELAEVREAVARDLEARHRQSRLDAQYRALRDRYRIRVEGAGP